MSEAGRLSTNATIIPRAQHSISRQNISVNALTVIRRLEKSGFEAYLVGGALRDMLLGKSPKDFDVATNATPEQIRRLFKNSRIIGRRFQIVHVRFGRDIIEVTTFRGNHKDPDQQTSNKRSAVSDHGMLLRDNVFGTLEEDAERRDFTINALYYSPCDFCLYDFTDGAKDIASRTIRLIGDPETRYREDPVRILRAVRFAAKLEFHLDPATEAAIDPLAGLLKNIPPARLFDESLKLFISGHGLVAMEHLRKHQLLNYLLYEGENMLQAPVNRQLVEQALINTDERLAQDKTVNPAFIFAVFLWPRVNLLMQSFMNDSLPPLAALHEAAQIAIQQQQPLTAIPKRLQIIMKEIWELQLRLPNRKGMRAFKLLDHPRLRAAYDFLLLREQAGEIEPGLGQWWTEFQQQSASEQQQSVNALGNGTAKTPRKSRRPRKRKATGHLSS